MRKQLQQLAEQGDWGYIPPGCVLMSKRSYAAIRAAGHPAYWDPASRTPWTSYKVGDQWPIASYSEFADDPPPTPAPRYSLPWKRPICAFSISPTTAGSNWRQVLHSNRRLMAAGVTRT